MTAKEKAIELRDNMFSFIPLQNPAELSLLNAKFCANVAVKEILKSIPYYISIDGYGSAKFENPDINFWQEVNTELEKL